MKAEAQKYGYAVNVVDASRGSSKQQSQVEDFISPKVAARSSRRRYDSQAIGSAIVEANKAGIPAPHRRHRQRVQPGQSVVVAHIDERQRPAAAARAGKLMCAAVPAAAAPVAILVDEPEVTSVQDRVRGFKAAIAAGSCPERHDRGRHRRWWRAR